MTDNDPTATARVGDALTAHFGTVVTDFGRQPASEDFAHIPGALDVPYVYWGIGGIEATVYRAA